MSCGRAREMLALQVEGDLEGDASAAAARHLDVCDDCAEFYEQLLKSQALLASLRQETVTAAECAPMRRTVMAALDDAQEGWGRAHRFERAVVLAFRQPSYAFATVALLAVLSASLLTQLGQAAPEMRPTRTAFDAAGRLAQPDSYRSWVLASHSSRPARASGASTARVYIDPTGYREYQASGTFAEGTIVVWEAAEGAPDSKEGPHAGAVLLASVKDTARFEGGWGFFDFTGGDGALRDAAMEVPVARGCVACHREAAETNRVFTQFYPALYSARQVGVTRAHT